MGAYERERAKRVRDAQAKFGRLTSEERRAAADGRMFVRTAPKVDGNGYRTIIAPFERGAKGPIVVAGADTGIDSQRMAYDIAFSARRRRRAPHK